MNNVQLKLVNSHLPLAQDIARKKYGRYRWVMSPEEVLSSAYSGLINASERYHNLPEHVFVPLAVSCIGNSIKNDAKYEIRSRGVKRLCGKESKKEYYFDDSSALPKDKEVYQLVCDEGISKSEASRQLGMSRRDVRNSLIRFYRTVFGEFENKYVA